MSDQLQIFETGTSLSDASLEQRATAAHRVLAAEPLDLVEREQLLLLVVAPDVFGKADG